MQPSEQPSEQVCLLSVSLISSTSTFRWLSLTHMYTHAHHILRLSLFSFCSQHQDRLLNHQYNRQNRFSNTLFPSHTDVAEFGQPIELVCLLSVSLSPIRIFLVASKISYIHTARPLSLFLTFCSQHPVHHNNRAFNLVNRFAYFLSLSHRTH